MGPNGGGREAEAALRGQLTGFMQVNRRAKTRATSTLAAFALAAVAAAAVAYAVSRRRKQQELEEEASKESEAAAESTHMPATPTPTPRGNKPGDEEMQTPEWLRTASTALARNFVPSPARVVQGLSDRLNGSRAPPEGASSDGDLPALHEQEDSVAVDREGAPPPVEAGAQQQVGRNPQSDHDIARQLPMGVALTVALIGVVITWAWNGTLWSDLAYGRLGWFVGNMVCE